MVSTLLLVGAACSGISSTPLSSSIGADSVKTTDVSLDLSGKGLAHVPESVFAMTDLEVLDFSHNELTGALPGEIRLLQSLQSLDVSGNQMTGVPAEIGQLSGLRYLNLSDNALTGLPNELGNLASLIRLDLRGNAVSAYDLEGIRAKLINTEILTD